jgi:hypothetical protein
MRSGHAIDPVSGRPGAQGFGSGGDQAAHSVQGEITDHLGYDRVVQAALTLVLEPKA